MQKGPSFNSVEKDFDWWSDLAKSDPQAFEKMRLAAIEEVIQSAPESQQPRLRGLQWQIDHERRRSSNPLSACMRISNMMWNALLGPGGLLESMKELSGPESEKPSQHNQAMGKVLQFCRSTK